MGMTEAELTQMVGEKKAKEILAQNSTKTKPKKQPGQPEFHEQAALFRMAARAACVYPELDLLNGSLNGVRLTIGQARKAKAAGMQKGYPDVQLPVARHGYHSMYIEMKHGKNRPEPEQKAWLRRLKEEGHYVTVAYSALEAWDEIMWYLGLE